MSEAASRLLDAIDDAVEAAAAQGLPRERAGAYLLAYAVRAMRSRLDSREVALALSKEATRLAESGSSLIH